MCHYWPVKKAIVNLPIRQKKENLKHFLTSNPESDGAQAPVVQWVDNAIHQRKLYPLDSAIGFPDTYQLHSDLSGG